MNTYKFYLKRAKKSKAPVKYSILAYIMTHEKPTARQIAKALHLKLNTVRRNLTKLFHEAEVNKLDYDENGESVKELRWCLEWEWNEQPSILTGLFMTQKDYQEFKNTDTFKKNEKYTKEVCIPMVVKSSSRKIGDVM